MLGRESGVSQWRTITQEMIDDFTRVTGDEQWIHTDVERARRESPFKAPVAHGFLTMGVVEAMTQEAVQFRGDHRLQVNYGFNRLRFISPVPAGARLRVRMTPQSIREIDGGVEVIWNILVELEGAKKPALAAEWLLRMYR